MRRGRHIGTRRGWVLPAGLERRGLWAAVLGMAFVLGAAALLGSIAWIATGCGGAVPPSTESYVGNQTGAEGEVLPRKIALIAPEKANDFGWNQQGVECARALAAELGVELEVADGAGYEDITPVFRQLAQGGADWIILWASGYNTVGPQLARETGVKTVVIGAFANGLVPGLSVDLETDAQNGAYLAGMVAALMSKSGTVGIVISADDENWNKMAGGFIVGARAARPDVDIKLAQAGQAAYADAPAGKRVTDSVIAAGADIIFGMGDGSTFGMIRAVENAKPPAGAEKVWFIDVIGDKSSLDDKGVLLTSVVWDYTPVLRQALDQMRAGTYGSEVLYLGLKQGGIRLLPSSHIPPEVQQAVAQAQADIEAGTIQVPVVVDRSELEALLR